MGKTKIMFMEEREKQEAKLPTLEELDWLFTCADDEEEERQITFNNENQTVIVDGVKHKIDANGDSKIMDDE